MIPLHRIRTATAIKAKYRGVSKTNAEHDLLVQRRAKHADPNLKIVFNETFWKASKEQLIKESFGKCAYCEANADVVEYGDVEHFRPKSIYWWLAYTYDNYLFACQICNQKHKSDNFPISAALMGEPLLTAITTDPELQGLSGQFSPDPLKTTDNYSLKSYLDAHTNEQAHLINPYFDNPAQYFAYEADDVLQEVKVIPLVPQYANHVTAAESYYGINRIELKSLRYMLYTKFKTYKQVLNELSPGPVRDSVDSQIADMLSDKFLFAGMNRYFDTVL